MALDAKSFCQCTREAIMKNIVALYYNADRSFDRDQCEQFYGNMSETINKNETVLSEQLKTKWSNLLRIKKEDQSRMHTSSNLPRILGYCVKKWIKKSTKECEARISNFSYGANLNDDEKLHQEYNIHFVNIRNERRLI